MMRRRTTRSAAILTALVLFAACGSDDGGGTVVVDSTAASDTTGATGETPATDDTSTGDTSTGETTGTDAAAPDTELDSSSAQDINPQPRDSLKQGGELRQAVSSLAENWNPYNVNGNEADFTDVRDPMSPQPFAFDDKGVASPNPDYLLDVQVDPGPPQVVTYTLNPKAVWNSGNPIDFDDYEATWQAMINPENQVVETEGWDQIASVEQGTDSFQVIVTFTTVYPDYQALFNPVVPAESVADPAAFNEGWLGDINPDWFTGPFILDNYDAAQGIVEEVPNPNWWGNPALLDRLVFRVVSTDAVPQAYANGELDTFDIGPDPNGFAIAQGTASGQIRAAAGPNWRHITMNHTAGLFTDQTIRQAIVMSLDRADIGASDLAGIPWPAKPLNNHIFVENQAGYADNIGALAYDPDGARAKLDEAGWVEGSDGIREKDGQRLTLKFSQLVGVPVSENEAQLVQAQLGEVGIEVEIVDVSQEDFGDVLVAGDFEMIAFSWIGTPFPFRGVQQLYGTGSDSNFAFSTLPDVDALIAEMSVETDVAARTDLANQIDVLLWDAVHTLPLYQRPELIAVNADIANFGAFGFSTPHFEDWGYVS
jgi:peptide/nickel transport system substrate-binding protein